jgi:nitrogen fixation protein NifQ
MAMAMSAETEFSRSVPPVHAEDAAVDESFDRHIIARLLLHAVAESKQLGEPVVNRLGLDGERLNAAAQFVHMDLFLDPSLAARAEEDEEEVMVRQILLENRSGPREVSEWLAYVVARRGMEPNHLWEDLGLAERPDLTKLLLRHFAPLACKNTRNMRWKRFLYRSLCEAEGFSMCPSPTCDACAEFHICYSGDSAEAVMARNNRAFNEAAAAEEKH